LPTPRDEPRCRHRRHAEGGPPQAGQPEAQLAGLKLSQQLYFTKDSQGKRPFRVAPATMEESLKVLVTYGGMDAATRGKADDYFTFELLP